MVIFPFFKTYVHDVVPGSLTVTGVEFVQPSLMLLQLTVHLLKFLLTEKAHESLHPDVEFIETR